MSLIGCDTLLAWSSPSSPGPIVSWTGTETFPGSLRLSLHSFTHDARLFLLRILHLSHSCKAWRTVGLGINLPSDLWLYKFTVTTLSLIITGLTFQTNLSTFCVLLTSYDAKFNRLAAHVRSHAHALCALGSDHPRSLFFLFSEANSKLGVKKTNSLFFPFFFLPHISY